MATRNDPHIRHKNSDYLRAWSAANRDLEAAIGLRSALRVLPLTFLRGSKPGQIFLLQAFRAAFVTWTSIRYSRSFRRSVSSVAQALDNAHVASNNDMTNASSQAAYAVYIVAREIGMDKLGDLAVDAADAAADAANSAANDAARLWKSVNADTDWVGNESNKRESKSRTAFTAEFMSQPLWIEEVRSTKNSMNFPTWARKPWDSLKRSSDTEQLKFGMWVRWYEALISGRKEGFFDGALRGKAERDLLFDIAKQPNKFWSRDVAVVNAEINSWVEKRKMQVHESSHLNWIDHSAASDADQPILVQRPSSHRFDRHGNRIEATPVTEPPFDAILAETIIIELREKAIEALASLTDNNADDIVRRAIRRLSESLQSSSAEIAEGILLMRANTLSAHRRAYADPGSERERAIRAVLDDLSSSVDNLVDCYPGIRQINANRLALDMQAEQAPEIEIAIDEITEIARRSPAVGPSGPAALDTGRDDVRDLTEKLQRETNLARAADYIATRGQIVASRLLDATNFASATLQSVGSELSGISSDTWREVRKSLPKAVGTGLSKGTEKALESLVERGPIVALAYWLAGPLAALAVLVPRLKGHAHKADQVKDKVQKKLDGD